MISILSPRRSGLHWIGSRRQLLQQVAEIVHSVLDQQACKKSRECETAIRKAIMEKFGAS